MTIYSHSRLSTFEQCKLKFKFKYIDNLEPDFEETIESFLGKQVHKTLEWIYNKENREIFFGLDDIIKFFIESWNKEFNSEIKIIKENEPVELYFNKGIKFLINYFIRNHPFRDNTIATEKKIFVNLDKDEKYKLIGFIDRLVHNEDNIFEIHDYKTGSLKTKEELDKDRQLALYSIAIRDSFKDVKDVHLIWHFLDHNLEISSKRTIEELENLKKQVINLINKIESTTNFTPNPSYLCNWCEFQSKCPAFKENEKEIRSKFYRGNTRYK